MCSRWWCSCCWSSVVGADVAFDEVCAVVVDVAVDEVGADVVDVAVDEVCVATVVDVAEVRVLLM